MPAALSLLQSCKSVDRATWQPKFLDQDEAKFLSTLLDTIIPSGEKPGALDVKADVFIDKVMAELYDDAGKEGVRKDFAKFNADCKANFGDVFADLTYEQRAAVLSDQEENSPTFNSGVWGTAVGEQEPVGFYRSMKSMALWAYFSSEEVGKNVLRYDPVPAGYDGCIDYGPTDVKWTFG